MSDEWLTTLQAGKLVKRSQETVIRWILKGLVAAVRVKTEKGWRYEVSKNSILARVERVVVSAVAATPHVAAPLTEPERAALRRHGLLKKINEATESGGGGC